MKYWAIRVGLLEVPFAVAFILTVMSGLYDLHASNPLGAAFWVVVAILLGLGYDRAQPKVLALAGPRR